MKKILFVFGTRPEAIKMAPVINIFKKNPNLFETLVLVTGQHRQMLDQVLEIFKIRPDYDLDLMSSDQTLENLTAKILNRVSDLIKKIEPSLIFVQGDTTTTFAASLAGFYQKISIGHTEAGLRTNNKYSPFPEEINRRITSNISTFHFPPTKESEQNLLNEGIDKKNIKITGNTVIDALISTSKNLDQDIDKYNNFFIENYGIDFNKNKTLLVTGHRRESFGDGFENICNAIKYLAQLKNIQIVYPVHLNPKVQEPVKRILGNIDNIHLIPPQDYVPFIYLMKKSYIILTDSGGVQEEAPAIGKPVLIMRDTTERPEGIKAGTAMLVGTEMQKIIDNVELLINNDIEYNKMAHAVNPYGDGSASLKIFNFILENLI